MQLKYGNYTHDANEAAISISRQSELGDDGRPFRQIETWNVSGLLQAASVAALTTAIAALESAYEEDGNTLSLVEDDGTATAHSLANARIVVPPSFPTSEGAEYTTYRTYQFTAEAEVELSQDNTRDTLEYQETIAFSGGGPRIVHLTTLTGPPVRQVTAQRTPYRATQSGRAVGRTRYPNPPGARFPSAQVGDPQIQRVTPRVVGSTNNREEREYEITWQYNFESASPLNGSPAARPF